MADEQDHDTHETERWRVYVGAETVPLEESLTWTPSERLKWLEATLEHAAKAGTLPSHDLYESVKRAGGTPRFGRRFAPRRRRLAVFATFFNDTNKRAARAA
jgi:hypothetical protein